MKEDKSYGIIPIQIKENRALFLVVKHNKGHWAFPKGHPEKGETPTEIAKRELKEETNITLKDIFTDSFFTERYSFIENGQKINKTNQYFIGIVENTDVKILQKEISEYRWVLYEEAIDLISFDESKNILREAKQYLDKKDIK